VFAEAGQLYTINDCQVPKCPLFELPIPDGKQLRIFLNANIFSRIVLAFIHDRKNFYGIAIPNDNATSRKKVIIESSRPKIVNDLDGKHVRSAILGSQLAKIYEAEGWEAKTISYLSDWGKDIGLLGAGF
jgi:arginyl-tRNA synthetase